MPKPVPSEYFEYTLKRIQEGNHVTDLINLKAQNLDNDAVARLMEALNCVQKHSGQPLKHTLLHINLTDNQITYIPDLLGFKELHAFLCAKNKVKIPPRFEKCPRLQTVDFFANPLITSIDRSTCGTLKLVHIGDCKSPILKNMEEAINSQEHYTTELNSRVVKRHFQAYFKLRMNSLQAILDQQPNESGIKTLCLLAKNRLPMNAQLLILEYLTLNVGAALEKHAEHVRRIYPVQHRMHRFTLTPAYAKLKANAEERVKYKYPVSKAMQKVISKHSPRLIP